MNRPAIPAHLANRPTVGGLIVPWVTVTLPDGSPDWRACIRHRVNACHAQRRCQIDGQHIAGPAVFLAADDQITDGQAVTDIPPVHPECRPYALAACPMLNGQRDSYAARTQRCTASPGNRCIDPGCDCGGWTSVEDRDMGGHRVGQWFEVWADRYTVTPHPDGALFAVIDRPRRVRAVRVGGAA